MKIIFLPALLFLTFLVACQQPQTETANRPAASRGVMSSTHQGKGVVEALDRENRTVQINHEEIKGYMEAMSMNFHTRDASILIDLKPGDRIEFTVEDQAGIITVTKIKKL